MFSRNDRNCAAPRVWTVSHPQPSAGLSPACALGDAIRRVRQQTAAVAQQRRGYLFDHKALARVFAPRAGGHQTGGIKLPRQYPEKWVVD